MSMAFTLGLAVMFLALFGTAVVVQLHKRRKSIASLAQSVLRLRHLLTEEAKYLPLGPGDGPRPDDVAMFEAVTQELEAQGFTILGDRMESRPSGARFGPSRWFADRDGTTCGWFAVLRGKAPKPVSAMVFFSQSDTNEFFMTGRGTASPSLAQPPNVTRQLIAWDLGLIAAIERHRASVSRASAPLKQVGSQEEAAALLQKYRTNALTWRQSQSAQALLEPDVRAILGKQFDLLGAALMKHLSKAA